MATDTVYYLEFPEENASGCSEFSFTYDEEDEEQREMRLVDMRKLNQLAVAFVKYHTGNRSLREMLAHRRLADRLVEELFPTAWDQLPLSFEYDEQLDDSGEYLHLLYFKMPAFTEIARRSLRLQQHEMTGKEVTVACSMTLLCLDSLFPSHLMASR